MKNFISIVNFIRGCEPREKMDLTEPVKNQIALAEKYNLPTTFLFQYDALINDEFLNLVKNCDDKYEFGLWLETPKPLVEKVGLKWRGREGFDWDWYSNVGMLVGYTTEERKLMLDECMRCFNEKFGYYPKTVGCWSLDGFSINHLESNYNIDAVLICKEQWGSDGYSLWGGYYSEAYYPCKNNMFCPASSTKTQITVPVFRMLGTDPIDQYMNSLGAKYQGVETLEPSWKAGKDPAWVNWFLTNYFDDNNIGINYAQAGQENSFGWWRMEKGLNLQFEQFVEKRNSGKIVFINSGELGRRFKEMYPITPLSTTVTRKENSSAVWFNNRNYRAGLYFNNDLLLLRDVMIFDDNYRERYHDSVTETHQLFYDNLPLVDCFRWSKDGNIGGAYFYNGERRIEKISDFETENIEENGLIIKMKTDEGVITVKMLENKIDFIFPNDGFSVKAFIYNDSFAPTFTVKDDCILMNYNGYDYNVKVCNGVANKTEFGYDLLPNDNEFSITF